MAARTLGLVGQVGKSGPIVMTGGVARNAAAVHFLERALDAPVTVPAAPQITGAYGAALLARDHATGQSDPPASQASVAPTPPSCATCDAVNVTLRA